MWPKSNYQHMKKNLILIALFSAGITVHAAILMKPYLQAVTTRSIYVMVECSSRDTVIVKYGSTDSFGNIAKTKIISATTASPVTFVHKIELTGLSAGNTYFYQAFQGSSTFPGSEFITAVDPGNPFRFTWMADFRTNVGVHDSIAALLLTANPAMSIYGGDLCVNSEYDSWKKEFFRKNELELISKVPFFNTPGNHEGWGANARAFTQNPESPSGTQDYYSFDYGDLHVLSINYELPYNENSPQYKFAESDLSSSTKIWKIVICHAPAYCAGGHGNDKGMIKLTKNVFEKYGVNLVISGHTHFYQHNLVRGIHHLIIGSAGAPLYTPEKSKYTVISAKDYDWATGDVTARKLTITVFNAAGKKLDYIELNK
jgi:3',5'-cyclic AMP phosphodiesterase CpdA